MPCHCGARQCQDNTTRCCRCCYKLNKFGERCDRWDCPCCYDDPKKDFNPDVNPGGFCQREDVTNPCKNKDCLPCQMGCQ